MKTHIKLWIDRWSASQVVFLLVLCAVLSTVALYAAHRFDQARASARHWQEIAIEEMIK